VTRRAYNDEFTAVVVSAPSPSSEQGIRPRGHGLGPDSSRATRDLIRERIDMVQLVNDYVPGGLQARGPDDHWGRCPFHEEQRASFHITPSRGLYKCFGCGKGGDVFRFVEEKEGVSFPEALKRLAERAGVRLEAASPEERAREARRASLLRASDLVAAFYERVLWSKTPAGERGRQVLASRGIDEETARTYRLGLAPDDGRALLPQLARERDIPLQALLDLGLVRSRDGGRPYDFFRDRLMFPICDEQGRSSPSAAGPSATTRGST
jgi:DNA primase